MVEVADLEDQNGLAETFLNLGTSNGHPPLAARISPALQADLKKVLDNTGLDDMQFASTETWAAALMIAQAETASLNSEYGIDRAVIKAAKGKPVVELEGARGQLALFDALPQREQRDLLEAIVRDAASPDGESASLAAAWREGNMALIAQETQKGLLADAELREVLFTGRNKRWSVRIQQAITSGKRPFIAVGAAHMAGPDGLPSMLQGQGFAAVRVQ